MSDVESSGQLEILEQRVAPHLRSVTAHPLWDALQTVQALRVFMEHHVYCVWDFMTLLKRLQIELTGIALPWQPVGRPQARRLINEIVTGEESDQLPDGAVHSHYELYLQAMQEIGADTTRVERFREFICANSGNEIRAVVADAVVEHNVPVAAGKFLANTMRQASGQLCEVVAAFAIGREEVIPGMFQGTLRGMNGAPLGCDRFVTYLDRHIELDGDTHGPMAMQLLASL